MTRHRGRVTGCTKEEASVGGKEGKRGDPHQEVLQRMIVTNVNVLIN